ncbi:hypothetical protein MJ560_13535 [Klebsiella pneumoniae]|nr:hypothetical protein MJ560_13535 [Klebsiella pneumoniae]
MHHWLGLSTTGNYRDGCMQDIHWTDGGFGYFPFLYPGRDVCRAVDVRGRPRAADIKIAILRKAEPAPCSTGCGRISGSMAAASPPHS